MSTLWRQRGAMRPAPTTSRDRPSGTATGTQCLIWVSPEAAVAVALLPLDGVVLEALLLRTAQGATGDVGPATDGPLPSAPFTLEMCAPQKDGREMVVSGLCFLTPRRRHFPESDGTLSSCEAVQASVCAILAAQVNCSAHVSEVDLGKRMGLTRRRLSRRRALEAPRGRQSVASARYEAFLIIYR